MDLITLESAVVQEKAALLRAQVITPENATKMEDLRKESNAYIKSIKNKIEEAKEEFLKPFTEKERQALEILAPLEEATKEFADAILNAKKTAFRNKVRERWEQLCSVDGEIIDFDSLYDPSWYGKPEKVWLETLIARLKKAKTKDAPFKGVFFIEVGTQQNARDIEDYCIKNKVVYRKEEF